MEEIKFSIGIPAYKAKFLYDCVLSIINQTYTNFELIIVNDASPEDLDSIVQKFSDERIIYSKNEKNYGAEEVIGNWNKCLSFATGEYFLLMGDDDTLDKHYLEEFYNAILEYPQFNVYHCRSNIIDENSAITSLTQSWPHCESLLDNMWHRLNGFRQQFISDFVYKRDFLIENNGFFYNKLAWASDDITAYLAMKNKGIIHINKPLLNYRRSPITISSSGSVELKLQAIVYEYDWYNDFLSKCCNLEEQDKIIKEIIIKDLDKLKRKKNIHTLAYSGFFNGKKYFYNLFYWLSKLKKYNISLKDYVFINLLALKKAKAKSR
ncbi:TPA: glycosyltransferase family 2 protein [Raoultella ornithinolytica]|uniref:glycosyltransferase family 2 protein n=1 Tax=Raoultella ornithinolytica TaxID=54291 RepID=UPI001A23D174|nr:glycosyltransferase family 2 protein [Raoultella ornithinolytica]WPJ14077.1 glycosyltransferase family 2 protein [Raoultella ornithinolytica]HAT1640292.1 glycosyltransferase family 2 protein [Raoultella ornithinolytica]